MKWRKISKTVAKSLLGLAVALLILELGVRLVRPQHHFAVTVNTWDRTMGTRQKPGTRGFVSCPEYDIDLIINSQGLRDREIPFAKADGTHRILCLGDSFTCGYGVTAEETFAKQLEMLLNQSQGTTWEVLNAGVGSTGTAQQLAYYTVEGYRYDPDLVVLCFFPGNDFWDNSVAGIFSLDGDRLVQREAQRTTARNLQQVSSFIPGFNSLFARSHLLNLLKRQVAAMHFRQRTRPVAAVQDTTAVITQRDALTRALLLTLHNTCSEKGSRLVVMTIPAPAISGLPQRTAQLRSFLVAEGIPLLDLVTPLQQAASGTEPLTYRVDGHWTAAGHQVVAAALYAYLLGAETGLDAGILEEGVDERRHGLPGEDEEP